MSRVRVNMYRQVLMSSAWKKRKRQRMEEVGDAYLAPCERCGVNHGAKELQLHHKTYERLGAELDADLELLCKQCHRIADRERREADPKFEEKVRRWANKHWASDWEERLGMRYAIQKYHAGKELNRR